MLMFLLLPIDRSLSLLPLTTHNIPSTTHSARHGDTINKADAGILRLLKLMVLRQIILSFPDALIPRLLKLVVLMHMFLFHSLIYLRHS